VTSIIAFFPPAVLFSMTSPLAISSFRSIGLRKKFREKLEISMPLERWQCVGRISGCVYLDSLGWPIAFSKDICIGCRFIRHPVPVASITPAQSCFLAAVLLIPLPVYHRGQDAGSVLLDQAEGYYQTIRVFTDNATYIRMDLGPNFHAKMSLADQEPPWVMQSR